MIGQTIWIRFFFKGQITKRNWTIMIYPLFFFVISINLNGNTIDFMKIPFWPIVVSRSMGRYVPLWTSDLIFFFMFSLYCINEAMHYSRQHDSIENDSIECLRFNLDIYLIFFLLRYVHFHIDGNTFLWCIDIRIKRATLPLMSWSATCHHWFGHKNHMYIVLLNKNL